MGDFELSSCIIDAEVCDRDFDLVSYVSQSFDFSNYDKNVFILIFDVF